MLEDNYPIITTNLDCPKEYKANKFSSILEQLYLNLAQVKEDYIKQILTKFISPNYTEEDKKLITIAYIDYGELIYFKGILVAKVNYCKTEEEKLTGQKSYYLNFEIQPQPIDLIIKRLNKIQVGGS